MAWNNPILDFNWSRDIEDTIIPQLYQPDKNTRPATYLSDGTPWGVRIDHYLSVQSDPRDIIKLKSGVAEKQKYRAHALLWGNTLDKYICQYAYLMELLSTNVNDRIMVALSVKTVERILKHLEDEESGNAKKLEVETRYVHYHKNEDATEGSCFSSPRIGSALYWEYFYRSLYTSPKATKLRLTLSYDGRRCSRKNAGDDLPVFCLEDYYWHEMASAISLTIEIAAILMEVYEAYQDKKFWDRVWQAFCEKALPAIVQSPLVFTRNTVARNFFQQILIEHTIHSYQLHDDYVYYWESASYWNELIEHATEHIKHLKLAYNPADIPTEQIATSCTHIMNLLSAVDAPVNIPKYIKNPRYGLALFCNPKHRYVDDYLHNLQNERTRPERHRGNAQNKYVVFGKVRAEVKAAIEFLRFLQECKQSNNTVIIEILDCLTDNIFEAYSALANATGGTIILGRQLSKKRKKYWDRKENIQSQYLENTEEAEGEETLQTWEKESTQIISELFCTLNDSKKVNINLLTKESIYVREINGEELYVIQVPKGDKQTVAVFIDSQWQCF